MKTLKEKIKVMQAALDGADIDFKLNGGVWSEAVDPLELEWMWTEFDYRVKPEPLECWVTVYNDHLPSTVHTSKEGALKIATNAPGPAPPSVDKGWTVRKFREVIE